MADPGSSHDGRKPNGIEQTKTESLLSPDCPDAGAVPRCTAPVKENSVIGFNLPPAMGPGETALVSRQLTGNNPFPPGASPPLEGLAPEPERVGSGHAVKEI